MLQGEHSAILSTFIELPFVIKIFVLSISEWRFYTGFTLLSHFQHSHNFDIHLGSKVGSVVGGSVVGYLTQDRGAGRSSLIGVTALCH